MKLPVKVLGMCGSLRSQSTNLRALQCHYKLLHRESATRAAAPALCSSKETSELVSTDKQELLVQQLEALKELSLKLNPQGSNPEL